MDDPRRVRLGHTLGRLRQPAQQGLEIGLLLMDLGAQGLAAHQLHRDVVEWGGVGLGTARTRAHPILTDLVDGDDVGMVERRGGLGLEREAPHALLALDQLGREDLERHVARQVLVAGAVDLAHPAGPQRADHAVMGDPVLGLQRSSHGRPAILDLTIPPSLAVTR